MNKTVTQNRRAQSGNQPMTRQGSDRTENQNKGTQMTGNNRKQQKNAQGST